ncbi:hypothetical protein ABTC74_19645, partial [Acinetobacter baumannii]
GGSIRIGRDIGISTQLSGIYRLESVDADLPLAASHVRGSERVPIDFQILPHASLLSTVGAVLSHDTRDDPVLPSRGIQLSASAEA